MTKLRLSLVKCLLPTVLCLAQACSHAPVRGKTNNVEALYSRGIDDAEDGMYPEALKSFGEVKTKFPYSRFAALSELRIADVNRKRGHFAEAVDGFRNFLKFHPLHDQAPYALLQVGETFFEQVPHDWFFLPPTAEKDPTNVRQAIGAYQDFLSRFADSASAPQAKARLAMCRRKLADHEMYVAQFYFKRQHFKSAALRAEGLLEAYPNLGLDAEALYIAGVARLQSGSREAAMGHFDRLLRDFPQSPEAARAAAQRQSAQSESRPHT